VPPLDRGNQPTIVFVTVCTAWRKRILADDTAANTIVVAWHAALAWMVGRYVILPDHIHLFCSPQWGGISLVQWVRYWRSFASRRWPRREDQPIWQANFWDTQLRHADSYEAKWEYVRNNPVRHGLVSHADDWPYAGELNRFEWD
jgi:REP element-mobilizing transposase RayT